MNHSTTHQFSQSVPRHLLEKLKKKVRDTFMRAVTSKYHALIL